MIHDQEIEDMIHDKWNAKDSRFAIYFEDKEMKRQRIDGDLLQR